MSTGRQSNNDNASPERPVPTADEAYGTLTSIERAWRDKQQFLASRGYMLRPRYHPDWIPSWRGTDLLPFMFEDSIGCPPWRHLIDATRMSDGKMVYIKRVTTGNNESSIAARLWAESLRQDPRNHSVPVLQILEDPEEPSVSYMVMPYLYPADEPPFDLVDDVVEFADQVMEGLAFMHEQGIAHRDCSMPNIMMEGGVLYPKGHYPVDRELLPDGVTPAPPPLSRFGRSVRYWYIDYGISVFIPPNAHPKLALGDLGQDQEVPERSKTVPYDPFKVDIFIIGNLFRKQFRDNFWNVDFFTPLIESMTQPDPSARPDAAIALQQWQETRSRLWTGKRLWALQARKAGRIELFFNNARSLFRVLFYGLPTALKRILTRWQRTPTQSSYIQV